MLSLMERFLGRNLRYQDNLATVPLLKDLVNPAIACDRTFHLRSQDVLLARGLQFAALRLPHAGIQVRSVADMWSQLDIEQRQQYTGIEGHLLLKIKQSWDSSGFAVVSTGLPGDNRANKRKHGCAYHHFDGFVVLNIQEAKFTTWQVTKLVQIAVLLPYAFSHAGNNAQQSLHSCRANMPMSVPKLWSRSCFCKTHSSSMSGMFRDVSETVSMQPMKRDQVHTQLLIE